MVTDLHIFEFPLSLMMALAFVLGLFLLSKNHVVKALSTKRTSAILLSIIATLLAVEGTWSYGLYHHWFFLTIVAVTMLSLGLASINDFQNRSITAFLCHAGLALVLWGGFFGAADTNQSSLKLNENGPAEHIAVDSRGNAVPLPFTVKLKDFKTEYYPDGTSPKQYTSIIEVDSKTMRTSVNHPCRYKGYNIYQSGYDLAGGTYSILKLVRDPWIGVLALGALMLLLGSLMNLKNVWSNWVVLATALFLAIVFTIISVARINFGTLPPALRSLWFVPHLVVYMLAYSVMALAVVLAIVQACRSTKASASAPAKLLATSSSLLLVGMMCGAVWAKQAWGDYWTWDPKECWAAVTWLLTVAGAHVTKKQLRLAFTLIAFLAIQVTWYGVNYLPSSSQSLHTYNKK